MLLDGTKLKHEELALCRSFDVVLTPSDRERDVLTGALRTAWKLRVDKNARARRSKRRPAR
jgi:hypothetical protein